MHIIYLGLHIIVFNINLIYFDFPVTTSSINNSFGLLNNIMSPTFSHVKSGIISQYFVNLAYNTTIYCIFQLKLLNIDYILFQLFSKASTSIIGMSYSEANGFAININSNLSRSFLSILLITYFLVLLLAIQTLYSSLLIC